MSETLNLVQMPRGKTEQSMILETTASLKYRYSNQFDRTMHNKSHLPRDEKAPHTLTIRRNVPGISWDSSVAI